MTNIKKEYLALDKCLSKACGWLQSSEYDLNNLIGAADDEELVGLFMDLDDEISRYSEIDTIRDKIKERLLVIDK